MGVLAYFEKVGDQGTTVTYQVGGSMEDLTKVLVLDKATRFVIPGDEPVTHQMLAAAQKIARLFRERGTWPEKGMVAS